MVLSTSAFAQTQTYYIAIEETEWDYYPGVETKTTGELEDRQRNAIQRTDSRVGSSYLKVIYRAYADDSFSHVVEQPEHQGLLGPTLRVTVGDTLKIVLRNNAARPYNLSIRGMSPTDIDDTTGHANALAPGTLSTLTWEITDRVGPGPADDSSVAWTYSSTNNAEKDQHSGLFGAIIVSRKGLGRDQAPPLDVDQEFVILTAVTDENISWHVADNLRRLKNNAAKENNADYYSSNQMAHINGYMHGTMPIITFRTCERVRLYHLNLRPNDHETGLRLHNNTLLVQQRRTDTLRTVSGGTTVADFIPKKRGKGTLSAAFPTLAKAGMFAHFVTETAKSDCP